MRFLLLLPVVLLLVAASAQAEEADKSPAWKILGDPLFHVDISEEASQSVMLALELEKQNKALADKLEAARADVSKLKDSCPSPESKPSTTPRPRVLVL